MVEGRQKPSEKVSLGPGKSRIKYLGDPTSISTSDLRFVKWGGGDTPLPHTKMSMGSRALTLVH